MSELEIYDYYVLFPNHQEGLRAHKEFKTAGIKCTIAPTPREASTSCGISLLVSEEYIEYARQIIEKGNIKTNGIAQILRKNTRGYKSC